MNKAAGRLEISPQEFIRLLKEPAPRRNSPEESAAAPEAAPITWDSNIRLLAHVALHSAQAREWLLDEPWDELLQNDPEAALLAKILAADINPDDRATFAAFLATLDPAEEAAVSALLAEKPRPNAVFVANAAWCEMEKRRILRRMDSIMASLKNPDLDLSEQALLHEERMQLNQRLQGIKAPHPPSV